MAVYGILTLYMLLFSRIAIQIFSPESASSGTATNIFGHKEFYIISLGFLIAPIIVKKRLAEFKFTTYILFFGVVFLTTLLSAKLYFEGSYTSRIQSGIITPIDSEVNSTQHGEITTENVLDSLNIAVASQGFVIALFPIYSDMKKDERKNM